MQETALLVHIALKNRFLLRFPGVFPFVPMLLVTAPVRCLLAPCIILSPMCRVPQPPRALSRWCLACDALHFASLQRARAGLLARGGGVALLHPAVRCC
eukprot:1887565-Rhodomonas_salina.1